MYIKREKGKKEANFIKSNWKNMNVNCYLIWWIQVSQYHSERAWNTHFRFNNYYVKSVQIRSFFWSVFSFIRTEYGVNLVFTPNTGKYGRVKTPHLDTFHAVNHWVLFFFGTSLKGYMSLWSYIKKFIWY